MDVNEKLVELDERISRLEKLELGEIAPDFKITPEQFEKLTVAIHEVGHEKLLLHSWIIKDETKLVCAVCGVDSSDCGATHESWYCL